MELTFEFWYLLPIAILIVVITVLVASVGHVYEFAFHSPPEVLQEVLNISIFTIPGGVIGGQIGPDLQKVIPADKMKTAVSVLFILVGIFMLYTLIGS